MFCNLYKFLDAKMANTQNRTDKDIIKVLVKTKMIDKLVSSKNKKSGNFYTYLIR